MDEDDNVIDRLIAAVESLDHRAPVILAYHAAIERELDRSLARKLPNPQLLKGLGFGQKVGVWAATQDRAAEEAEANARHLLTLNELRNAIAHGDNKTVVDGHLKRLLKDSDWANALDDQDAVHFAGGWLFGIVNEFG